MKNAAVKLMKKLPHINHDKVIVIEYPFELEKKNSWQNAKIKSVKMPKRLLEKVKIGRLSIFLIVYFFWNSFINRTFQADVQSILEKLCQKAFASYKKIVILRQDIIAKIAQISSVLLTTHFY